MKKSMKDRFYDIAIIGGGASGLAAAISAGFCAQDAGRPAMRIVILERRETPGKKLSATGNGRCNLSNTACAERAEVDGFFARLGLLTRTDSAGRIYPYSEEAGAVTALLIRWAKALHTEILTNCRICRVSAVTPPAPGEEGGFLLEAEGGFDGKLRCRKLLIAAGGKSCSQFGTTGDSYVFARSLGHTVNRLAPSLVPVEVKEELSGLAGVRAKAVVRLLHDGQEVCCEEGEVQFNRDCLSGICVMNLSKLLQLTAGRPLAEEFSRYTISLDLVPELEAEALEALLRRRAEPTGLQAGSRAKREEAGMEIGGEMQAARCLQDEHSGPDLLTGLVKGKLAAYVAAHAGDTPEKLAHALKQLEFHVCGTKGWQDAQVTRGGVDLTEVDLQTMQSKRVPGLYFAGEALDYDGFCGGYNLHFAWLSGLRAGKDMGKDV